ncbi:hypothetical protein TNCV_3507601 [Trichonephila clavipes]|uniref:Uncharacterized protein n=1 Tax=Trichonephila clavipes TaxID=2585209 RepID=A0A8X6S1J5_TRICX|nr:hypothetical protein TNCV_3507601 [Trichonephila clavipes]
MVTPSIVMFYRPFGNFTELNCAVTCMVLKAKANDRRTSSSLPHRGPRSDYVRQLTHYRNLSYFKYQRLYQLSNTPIIYTIRFSYPLSNSLILTTIRLSNPIQYPTLQSYLQSNSSH